MATVQREKVRVAAIEAPDGWRWQILRGDRLVGIGLEAYARRDALVRATARMIGGLAGALGFARPVKPRQRKPTERARARRR